MLSMLITVSSSYLQIGNYDPANRMFKKTINQIMNSNNDNLNNEIRHFFSVEQLSFIIRLKHKYYFFNTLLMVLTPKRRFYRRIAPYFYCLYKKASIFNKFGVQIYPSN